MKIGIGDEIQMRMSTCCGSDPTSQMGKAQSRTMREGGIYLWEQGLDFGITVYSCVQVLVCGRVYWVQHPEPAAMTMLHYFFSALW